MSNPFYRGFKQRERMKANEKREADLHALRTAITPEEHEARVVAAQRLIFEAAEKAREGHAILAQNASSDDLLLVEIARSDLARLSTRLRVYETKKPTYKAGE